MKIQIITNTCDVEGIKVEGEIMVILKDGEPIAHHDYSDGSLEVDYISNILSPFGIELEFEDITPDKNLVKKINQYLKNHY